MIASSATRSNPKKTSLLAAYEVCGVISHACRAAGVSRSSHYNWMNGSEDYRKRFEEARVVAAEYIETEARRRAVDGWDEPVFQKGKRVGTKRCYSDLLLVMLLNAKMPEKFRRTLDCTDHSNYSQRQINGIVR